MRGSRWPLQSLAGVAPLGMRTLVRQLPRKALAPLAGAIFLLFSTMGFLVDIMAGGVHPLPLLVSNVVFSGVVALFYAASAFSWRYLAAGVVLHLLYTTLVGRVFDMTPVESDVRLTVDAIGVIVAMTLSYALFLTFINSTALKYVKAQAEIELARQIHAVLVPQVGARIGAYDFFGVSEASGEVGGDLVDLVRLSGDSGDGWIGYIADVSGHGVSSGVLMGMVKSAAHMHLRRSGAGTLIAPMLDELNEVLYPLKQSSMFVTFACVADTGGGALEFSVAGHLPILHVACDGEVSEFTTPQIPVGMFQGRRFESARLTLSPGEMLVLVTDGLTEVFDEADEEFGLERLKGFIASHRAEPLDVLGKGLLRAARAHGVQLDDQTILLVRGLEQ